MNTEDDDDDEMMRITLNRLWAIENRMLGFNILFDPPTPPPKRPRRSRRLTISRPQRAIKRGQR